MQEVSSLVSLEPGCPWLLRECPLPCSAVPTLLAFTPCCGQAPLSALFWEKKQLQTHICPSALFPWQEIILCRQHRTFFFKKSHGIASLSSVGYSHPTVHHHPGSLSRIGSRLGYLLPIPDKARSDHCLISCKLMKQTHQICPVRWYSDFLQPALCACPWNGSPQPEPAAPLSSARDK